MRIQSQRETFAWRLAAKIFNVPVGVADHHKMFDATDKNSPMYGEGSDGYDVGELAHSIKRQGIKEPLVMSTNGTNGVIEDGNHRLAAAKQAGLSHVPMRFVQTPKSSGPELHSHIKNLLSSNPDAVGDWDLDFPP